MIHIIRAKATEHQMNEMLQVFGSYAKLAVDVRRKVLAGGGEMHADCESELLLDGSQQEDIWGADWTPATQSVDYESLINIRPKQDNRSMGIEDHALRDQIDQVVTGSLGGVPYA